jgi:hypothetical protein
VAESLPHLPGEFLAAVIRHRVSREDGCNASDELKFGHEHIRRPRNVFVHWLAWCWQGCIPQDFANIVTSQRFLSYDQTGENVFRVYRCRRTDMISDRAIA